MSKPGYPEREDPIPVFLITYHDGGIPNRLGPARDEIRDFLFTHGLRVHVEISILEYFWLLTFPIKSEHKAVAIYNDAKIAIIHSLHTNLGEMWEGLCLFNTGFSPEKVTPTVVVHVKPLSVFDWSSLRSELLILTSGDPEIDISFRPGVINTSMNSGSSGTPQAAQSKEPGSSIGAKGVLSSGTLGGYFDLKIGGEIHKGFLTNYHVVAPSNAPEEIRKKADLFGSSPAVDDETRSEVVAPSQRDVNREMTSFSDFLESLKAKQTRLEEEKYRLEMCGDAPEEIDRVSTDITTNSRHIDFMENQLKELRSLPSRLGKVLLSSGRTIFEERISDWAFVELDSGLLPCANVMPAYRTTFSPSNDARHFYYFYPGVAAPEAPATGFGEIQEGNYYLKQGKSTDVTVGLCNGTKFFNPKGVRCYVRGIEQSMEGTEELVITPINGEKDFCRPGDSGSLVYDIYGKISGLLFGQIDDKANNIAGMVTTFPSILKAIEKKGGGLIDPNAAPDQGGSGDL